MIKKEAGFTLIELMVTMVIFVLAIAAAFANVYWPVDTIQTTRQNSRD